MEGTALVLKLSELIGLKITFDVDLRDVGKKPHWDVDILRAHCKGSRSDGLFTLPIDYGV